MEDFGNQVSKVLWAAVRNTRENVPQLLNLDIVSNMGLGKDNGTVLSKDQYQSAVPIISDT